MHPNKQSHSWSTAIAHGTQQSLTNHNKHPKHTYRNSMKRDLHQENDDHCNQTECRNGSHQTLSEEGIRSDLLLERRQVLDAALSQLVRDGLVAASRAQQALQADRDRRGIQVYPSRPHFTLTSHNHKTAVRHHVVVDLQILQLGQIYPSHRLHAPTLNRHILQRREAVLGNVQLRQLRVVYPQHRAHRLPLITKSSHSSNRPSGITNFFRRFMYDTSMCFVYGIASAPIVSDARRGQPSTRKQFFRHVISASCGRPGYSSGMYWTMS